MRRSKVLFRASSVGKLLVDPRTNKAKEAGEMSETAKRFVESEWLRREYGYDEPVVTTEMLKGHLCEQDSIGLVSRIFPEKEFRVKNKEEFKNDFFAGHPDIILPVAGVVEDVKTCWSLRTFFEKRDVESMHIVQGNVYLDLIGCRKFRVHYCLIPTPEELIIEQENRFFYKFGGDINNKHYKEASENLWHNNRIIETIPEKDRIKTFRFDYDTEMMTELKRRVGVAREYYNSITL